MIKKFVCAKGHLWYSVILLVDNESVETAPACPVCLIQAGKDARGDEIKGA